MEAVEEATVATAYQAVAWARRVSSWQVWQDRWRQKKSDNGLIWKGMLGRVKMYSGDHLSYFMLHIF